MDKRYKPTNKLRVMRRYYSNVSSPQDALQQWWCLPDDGSPTGHLNVAVGEWVDVEVVEEGISD